MDTVEQKPATAPQPVIMPPAPKKSGVERFMGFISIFLIVVIELFLLYKKRQTPEFNLFFANVILAIILGLGIVGYFYYNFKKKNPKQHSKDNILPPPITPEQAYQIAQSMISGPRYSDYIRGFLYEKTKHVGKHTKSQIYIFAARGKYESQDYVVVMNMHYPLQKRCLLNSPTEREINEAVNGLADFPEDTPITRETIAKNSLLGTEVLTRETAPTEQKQEEGDLK